jgi:hypothetical protein
MNPIFRREINGQAAGSAHSLAAPTMRPSGASSSGAALRPALRGLNVGC